MKSRIIIYTAALMLWFLQAGKADAQSLSDNGIFYHSFSSPWAYSLNPALFPKGVSSYTTLPRTNINVSLPFSYSDLSIQYDNERQVAVMNLTDFLNKMYERKFRTSANVDMNVLGVGYSLGERFKLGVDAGIRTSSITTLPIEVTRLVTEGNLNANRRLELGTTMLSHTMSYAYASVGLTYVHPDIPLSLGARFNLLDGIQIASIDKLALDVLTMDDTSSLMIELDYMARLGGIMNVQLDDLNKTELKFSFPRNFGFTFDLGASFSLFDMLDVSASILDVGPGMRWSQNIQVLVPKEGKVVIPYDGFDIERIRDTAYLRNKADSLLDKINYRIDEEEFWYAPPTKAYVGASFTAFNMLRFGYLFHGEWSNGWFRPKGAEGIFRCNNTISLHANLFGWFEAGVANSISYDGEKANFLNPGILLSFNPGKSVQLYVAVDYVSSIYAVDLRSAHVYLGMNILHFND